MEIKYPLTTSQYDIWVDQQIRPKSPLYNIGGYINIEGPIVYEIFNKSINKLINNNDALKLNFSVDEKGTPYQMVKPNVDYELPYLDFSREPDPEESAIKWMEEDFKISFDLNSSNLLCRQCLLKVSDNHYYSYNKYHHLLVDGWGLSLTVEHTINEYNAMIKENIIDENTYSYINYIDDNNEYLKSKRYTDGEEYWKEKYSRKPDSVLSAPVFQYPESINSVSDRSSLIIKSEDYTKLIDLGKTVNATTNNVVLTILYMYLHKITGLNDIVVGIPLLNRSKKSFKKTIGLFVDTSPLLINIDPEKTVKEMLSMVGKGLMECFRHQRYPAGNIEKLAGTNSQSRLYDIIFSYEKHSYENKILDYKTEIISISNCHQNNALTLHVEEYQDGEDVIINFDYRPDVFQKFPIESMTGQFESFYKEILVNPDSKIAELEIITNDEKRLILKDFNNTEVLFPQDKTIVQMFEEQVDKTPDNIAVIYDGIELSYRELNDKANIVANFLIRNYDINSNDFVGIMLNRSEKMVIGILGILKSGAAYIPIDPEYPESRIKYILEDSKLKTVLSEVDSDGYIDINNVLKSVSPKSNIDVKTGIDSYLYAIYTSGTTGNPKGTIISNKNYINYISWAKDYYFENGNTGSFGLFSSISFDLTTTSIFLTLLRGKTLGVFSQQTEISKILTEIFNSDIIDCVKLTPSHISILPSLDIKKSNIKLAIVGGEELLNDQVKILKQLNSEMRIVNEYGPTEATVGCIIKQIDNPDEKILIGKPISNTKIYIMNENNLSPVGIPGEICVGGSGVGVGYLNKPELTNVKFTPNPYLPGERIYLTGDLGSWMSSGDIEYLGRMDDQVKIRGFRIELGEIENNLLNHLQINKTVVVVNKKENGDKILVAYYVSDNELDISELQTFLGKTLPDYMVPSIFIHMDSLPLTVNGKVDRKSLPDPELDNLKTGVEFVAAESGNEKILTEIWKDVLGSGKQIGIDDNFFRLGGDSIKAIQIMSRLNQKGLKGEVVMLFDNPTIRGFATHVKENIEEIDQSQVTGEISISPVQKWFFKDLDCPRHHYNQAVMLQFKEEINDKSLNALAVSVRKLLCHHDALRMSFKENDGVYIQENRAEVELYFEKYDLADEELPSIKMEEIANETQNSFNLSNDTLIRFVFFRLKDGARLLIVAHHLIIDGVSWRILIEDLESGYRQALENKEITLPLKTTSFKGWNEKLTAYSGGSELKKSARFWRKAGLTKNILPENCSNPDKERAESTICLNKDETNTLLTKMDQAFNAGINDVLLTALAKAVFSWCGKDVITIDLESHGRPDRFKKIDLSRTIGWFTSVYPVVLDITECDDLEEEIISVKENLEEIRDNGIAYGVLKYLSGELENEKESDILFNYLGQFDNDINTETFEIASESVGNNVSPKASSNYKLTFNGMVTGGKFSITLDSQVYSKEELDEILTLFKKEIAGIIQYAADKIFLISELKSNRSKTTGKNVQRIRI